MITLSMVWGILSIVGMLVAFMPCLGSLNWLNIPFSGIGLIIGIIAVANDKTGKRGGAAVGIVLCSIAALFGLIRLVAGGGIV